MSKRKKYKCRKMRPLYLVICEGETERAYVNLLRQRYKLPIKIKTKIAGDRISQKLINKFKSEYASTPSEMKKIDVFLMYDGDVEKIIQSIKKCEGHLLISKPCIENWFIAHYQKLPEKEITSNACINCLSDIPGWEDYKKSILTVKQQDELWEKRICASDNARCKNETSTNYSTVYHLIDILEKEKANE